MFEELSAGNSGELFCWEDNNLKETRVENEHYRIEVDDTTTILYLTILNSETSMRVDKNLVSNVLSYCMTMPKSFKFIFDLRYFDPRLKSEWFQVNMDRVGQRMNEISAGPQAHILNDIFWYKLYQDYPEVEGQYPVIIEDENTLELIGRFNTIAEGEDWLNSL